MVSFNYTRLSVPYDRVKTESAWLYGFSMCEACSDEYTDMDSGAIV